MIPRRASSQWMRWSGPPEPKPLILMYHRIADCSIDPWGLAVTPDRFAEQLAVLRRTRECLPLPEFIRQLVAGTLRAQAVAVTFDDGYVDNLLAAKPCLTAADVPATVFLVTGYFERAGEFWWDELARLILLEDGPQSLELSVRGRTIRFELGRGPARPDARAWFATSPPLTRRQEIYLAILNAFRLVENEERQGLMFELRSVFSNVHRSNSGRAMTCYEVLKLATDRLVTIGAHTITHPVLTALEADVSYREIADSKANCEALIGTSVATFAYPYGQLNDGVRAAVRSSGFTCRAWHDGGAGHRRFRYACAPARPDFQLGWRRVRAGTPFGVQGNRVKKSCGDKAGEEFVVPRRDLALEAEAVLARSPVDQVEGHVLNGGEIDGA
jgi:peptidoglycan/xylan/chitin deacetylase (PgdA/CDA1 family)